MRRIIILPLALLICGSLGDRKTDGSQSTSGRPVGFNGLAKTLYKEIAKDETGNFVFSPISATIALTMLYSTKHDYRESGARSMFEQVKSLLIKFNSFTEVDLKLANKIYLTHLATLTHGFDVQARVFFNSSAEPIDFTNRDNAVRVINEWCEKQTNSKIKNIITSDQINDETLMLLLNTVYFKGNWADQFDESLTSNQQFRLKSGIIISVPTMCRREASYPVGYLPDLKARFIEIPYKKDLSMFIVLPDPSTELEDIEKQIDKLNYRTLSTANYASVNLYLPKFKIETSIDLKSTLAKIGINEMVTSTGPFSSLTNYPNMALNDFSQKAFLEVNERGSEAAAITSLSFDFKMDSRPPQDFRVDRSFMAIIGTKDEMLFMARVDSPSA